MLFIIVGDCIEELVSVYSFDLYGKKQMQAISQRLTLSDSRGCVDIAGTQNRV